MDDLDHKILQLLAENARMPVKDIAQRVSLTSPAVSSRIHRLEQEGVIGGYTVVLRHPDAPGENLRPEQVQTTRKLHIPKPRLLM